MLARDRLGREAALLRRAAAAGSLYGSEPAAILASGLVDAAPEPGRDRPVPRARVRPAAALTGFAGHRANSRRASG